MPLDRTQEKHNNELKIWKNSAIMEFLLHFEPFCEKLDIFFFKKLILSFETNNAACENCTFSYFSMMLWKGYYIHMPNLVCI